MRIDWKREGAMWRADIGNITVGCSPEHTRNGKPARGTRWRAWASVWCEASRCVERFGADELTAQHASADEAKRAAEAIYNAERAARAGA